MQVVEYLNNQLTPFYRLVLDVLLEEEKALGLHLPTAEVGRRLQEKIDERDPDTCPPPAEQLLSQLHSWRNVDRIQNTHRKGTANGSSKRSSRSTSEFFPLWSTSSGTCADSADPRDREVIALAQEQNTPAGPIPSCHRSGRARSTGAKPARNTTCEGGGVPLATTLTGGKRNDITQLIPLVDAVPPVRGRRGRPRRRPELSWQTAATTPTRTETQCDDEELGR